jgi:RNA polymerase sigma-70 factor, ECF subfamily
MATLDSNNSAQYLNIPSQASNMPSPIEPDVTQLLVDWQRGDKMALDQLMPLVYRELRKVAASYLKAERRDHTLQPTALIHEGYLRMVDQEMPHWQNRAHFFGVASRLLRQILIDHARIRRASKRGGEQFTISLEEAQSESACTTSDRILNLDAAITKLASMDERKSKVLEMRVFGGMKLADIALALHVSEPTIKRDIRMARAWLRGEIGLKSSV